MRSCSFGSILPSFMEPSVKELQSDISKLKQTLARKEELLKATINRNKAKEDYSSVRKNKQPAQLNYQPAPNQVFYQSYPQPYQLPQQPPYQLPQQSYQSIPHIDNSVYDTIKEARNVLAHRFGSRRVGSRRFGSKKYSKSPKSPKRSKKYSKKGRKVSKKSPKKSRKRSRRFGFRVLSNSDIITNAFNSGNCFA